MLNMYFSANAVQAGFRARRDLNERVHESRYSPSRGRSWWCEVLGMHLISCVLSLLSICVVRGREANTSFETVLDN